jgi:hypothetical protein
MRAIHTNIRFRTIVKARINPNDIEMINAIHMATTSHLVGHVIREFSVPVWPAKLHMAFPFVVEELSVGKN